MQSPSLMTSNNPNFLGNTSGFWSNGGYRKRKLAESDFEEKSQHKMFLTEEKLITNMQTLSLDLFVNNNTPNAQTAQEDEEKNDSFRSETRFELHKLLKDNLRKDDLQDNLINKLYDLERKKLSMQIVPYMPIHPAQLNSNNNHNPIIDEKEQKNQGKIKKENDDHLFKKPFLPTPYTVEEPCENILKRPPRMKRSYSQSIRSNSNLSVVELKNDPNDSSDYHSKTDYFIFEPSTPVLLETSTNHLNSSNRTSICITEYFDFSSSSSSNNNNNSDIDMQSIILSDINDKMDDDDDN